METKKKTMKMEVKRPLSEGQIHKNISSVQCISKGIDFLVSSVDDIKKHRKTLAVIAAIVLLFVIYMNIVSGIVLSAIPIFLFLAEPWCMSFFYASRKKFASGILGKQLKLSLLLTFLHVVVCAIVLAPSIVIMFMDNAAAQSIANGDYVILPSGYTLWLNVAFIFAAIVMSICIMLNVLSQRHMYLSV